MAEAKLFILTLMMLVASVASQQRQMTLVVSQNPNGQVQVLEPSGAGGNANQQQVNELQVVPGQPQQQQQQQLVEVEDDEDDDDDEVEEQVVNGLLDWLDKKKKKKKEKKEKKRGEKQEKKRRKKKEKQPLIIPVQPSEPKHQNKVIHIHINIVKKDEHKHKKDGGYHHYHEGHYDHGGHDKHYNGKHSWPLLSHHHNWDTDFGGFHSSVSGAGDHHDEYGGYASNQVANYTKPLAGNGTATVKPTGQQ